MNLSFLFYTDLFAIDSRYSRSFDIETRKKQGKMTLKLLLFVTFATLVFESQTAKFELRSTYDDSTFVSCTYKFWSSRACVIQNPEFCMSLNSHPCRTEIQRHYHSVPCKRAVCHEVFNLPTGTEVEVRFVKE